MARPAGSGREYQLAKKTVDEIFKGKNLINESYPAALQVMVDIMMDPKAALALKMGAAKFFIEYQHKIAKEYGDNPKPADFVVDDASVTITETKEDENQIINVKFKQG
ncbi:MAG: hypothetical protein GY799_21360 [Desulfobulbaceae bacterium]|nr:hypothetical protein [Desulfobulbaceae bacterium]